MHYFDLIRPFFHLASTSSFLILFLIFAFSFQYSLLIFTPYISMYTHTLISTYTYASFYSTMGRQEQTTLNRLLVFKSLSPLFIFSVVFFPVTFLATSVFCRNLFFFFFFFSHSFSPLLNCSNYHQSK